MYSLHRPKQPCLLLFASLHLKPVYKKSPTKNLIGDEVNELWKDYFLGKRSKAVAKVCSCFAKQNRMRFWFASLDSGFR